MGRVLLTAILTALLVLTHLWAHERAMFMGTPILVGFAYIAATLVGLQILGNDVPNMLRSFGLAAVGAEGWDAVSAASFGALCGSLAAVLVDALVFEELIWQRGEAREDEESAK